MEKNVAGILAVKIIRAFYNTSTHKYVNIIKFDNLDFS